MHPLASCQFGKQIISSWSDLTNQNMCLEKEHFSQGHTSWLTCYPIDEISCGVWWYSVTYAKCGWEALTTTWKKKDADRGEIKNEWE